MFTVILKRSGQKETFQPQKIADAIFKAAKAVGGDDIKRAEELTQQVVDHRTYPVMATGVPRSNSFRISLSGYSSRTDMPRRRRRISSTVKREKAPVKTNALIGATIDMFSDYLADKDWGIKENANTQKSVNGLNNYIREAFTKKYWLHESISRRGQGSAYQSGDCHIHDLGFFGPYCAGWDLRQLLMQGFGGIPGKVESKPAKHMRSFLGQIVNSTFTTQGETAGAQAWSSF